MNSPDFRKLATVFALLIILSLAIAMSGCAAQWPECEGDEICLEYKRTERYNLAYEKMLRDQAACAAAGGVWADLSGRGSSRIRSKKPPTLLDIRQQGCVSKDDLSGFLGGQ